VGFYIGYPPSPLPTGSTQVFNITSNDVKIPDDSSPEAHIPQITPKAYIPQYALTISMSQPSPKKNLMTQPTPPLWKMVHKALTQIPLFYPPLKISTYHVASILTLPNMVIIILIWYLEPPTMVPVSSLPPRP
jgi:hypothetical protein